MTDESFAKATKGGTKASREIVDAVAMQSANQLLTRRVLDQLKAIATGEGAGEEKPKAKKAKKAAKAEETVEAPVAETEEAAPAKKKATKKKAE
jgi:hypothetical protein